MRDSLALALVRAELCRAYAQKAPRAASRRSPGMRHVFGKMLRPWRRARIEGRGSGGRLGGA